MTDSDQPRHSNGQYASASFQAIYDALEREVKRIDQLRAADQLAVAAALSAAEKAVAAALTASSKAVDKSEEAQQRTNEGQNEFRQQLKDQAGTFATLTELHAIESTLREADDRLLALVGDVVTRSDLKPVADAVRDMQGRSAGSSATVIQAVAVFGAVIAAVSLAVTVLIVVAHVIG